MSTCNNDVCVMCSIIVENGDRNISCQLCSGYVHTKCAQLENQPKRVKPKEWVCSKCTSKIIPDSEFDEDETFSDSDIEQNVIDLNASPQFKITDVDLKRYDEMIFNPLRFDCNPTEKRFNDAVNDDGIYECSYLTPEQFCLDSNATCGKFSFLNVNIRSLSKNLENLKECIDILKKDFSVIGISETHLKQKPDDYYNLNGYKVEYTNRIGREKGGVCMYVSNQINYKLRTDLCNANSNYESCFIEIECINVKNIVVGVVYRAHTCIDNFLADFDPVLKKLNSEKKTVYIMGDFNIDLLKVDTHRPTHDYLELIYSYSLLPTIYKPTRITETTATIIDNILTNDDNIIKSSILVTDITDHLPTVLETRGNLTNISCRFNHDNKVT